MPDLNFHTPAVQDAVLAVGRAGVAGAVGLVAQVRGQHAHRVLAVTADDQVQPRHRLIEHEIDGAGLARCQRSVAERDGWGAGGGLIQRIKTVLIGAGVVGVKVFLEAVFVDEHLASGIGDGAHEIAHKVVAFNTV